MRLPLLLILQAVENNNPILIRDVSTPTVIRLNELYAANGQVGFSFTTFKDREVHVPFRSHVSFLIP